MTWHLSACWNTTAKGHIQILSRFLTSNEHTVLSYVKYAWILFAQTRQLRDALVWTNTEVTVKKSTIFIVLYMTILSLTLWLILLDASESERQK